MEEVNHKVKWDVQRRADKHTPHTHPAWRIRIEIDSVTRQLIIPTCQQLEEDAEWKK